MDWTAATRSAFVSALVADGAPSTAMPRSRSIEAKVSAAARAGSAKRSAGPWSESPFRPSSAIRAVTRATFSLSPMGWRPGPE